MAALTTSSIIQALISKSQATRKTGDMNQVKQQLNQLLKQAAEFIRDYIIIQSQVGHRNKFKSNGDFQAETQVGFGLSKGLSIDLPDYADEMDRGRKPGSYPPAAAILAWVKEYNIQARASGKSGRISTNQFVFLIQRAIYRNGIKARPFIANAQDFAEKLAGDIAEQIILPSLVAPVEALFTK
jgi:hypothetical protein